MKKILASLLLLSVAVGYADGQNRADRKQVCRQLGDRCQCGWNIR